MKVSTYLSGGCSRDEECNEVQSYLGNEKHQNANPQHIVLRVFTKQCSLLHRCQYTGVHLCVLQMSTRSWMETRPVSWWCYYCTVKLLILIMNLCIPPC